MKILFLHGWTASSDGRKPTFLADHGHEVFNPGLPEENFAEAVRIAKQEFDVHRPDVVVGSSRGGAMAMNVKAGATPLLRGVAGILLRLSLVGARRFELRTSSLSATRSNQLSYAPLSSRNSIGTEGTGR